MQDEFVKNASFAIREDQLTKSTIKHSVLGLSSTIAAILQMPSANAILRAAEHAGLYLLLVLCSPCLCLRFVTRRRGWRGCGGVMEPIVLPYPSPLSTIRIDIGRDQPPIEQPRTCHLLHLPAELRDLILEMAVGNRLVHLDMVPNQEIDALIMQSTCYAPSEEPDTPNPLLIAADKIPVALLLSCRQVYLEALPIMHQRNTFYFYLKDFQSTIQCSLGEYCLPNIRLHDRGVQTIMPWEHAFLTLQQMRLTALTLEFSRGLHWTKLQPNIFSVDNACHWCRSLLAIRGLRNLDIFSRYRNPYGPGHPMYRETVIQTLHELMIGLEADEKYKALLAGRDIINA
ncbi:hypothetical protein C8R44DRAFT_984662 [Mycena epipterygia]|nr:hypothetical protein C8R44DRAFT_984662 [Mycena epipterygia]